MQSSDREDIFAIDCRIVAMINTRLTMPWRLFANSLVFGRGGDTSPLTRVFFGRGTGFGLVYRVPSPRCGGGLGWGVPGHYQ